MAFAPPEANAPLVIDANAVLPFKAALQRFEPVARRHGHLPQFRGGMQSQQLASCAALNVRREPAGHFRPEYPLRFRARETLNHRGIVTPDVNIVKSLD